MKHWKGIVGLLLIVLAVVFGIYVGGWVLFIGGIVQIVESIKMSPVSAFGIAFGALRMCVASALGVAVTFLSLLPGIGMVLSWLNSN